MAQRGRPRSFDPERALDAALDVFWRRGYDGTSLADLQEAMGGLSAPSLYAAFGSKEALFRQVVERYRSTVQARTAAALEDAPTAESAVRGALTALVDSISGTRTPKGCMVVLAALPCSRTNEPVHDFLRDVRREATRRIAARIRRGQAEGDVPSGADAAAMAAFYAAVLHGLSVQAHDGASRSTLAAVVAGAMAAWDRLARPDAAQEARRGV